MVPHTVKSTILHALLEAYDAVIVKVAPVQGVGLPHDLLVEHRAKEENVPLLVDAGSCALDGSGLKSLLRLVGVDAPFPVFVPWYAVASLGIPHGEDLLLGVSFTLDPAHVRQPLTETLRTGGALRVIEGGKSEK